MDLKESSLSTKQLVSHWYYRAKAKKLLDYIKPLAVSQILDVGSGSAFFTKYLLSKTSIRTATCIDIFYKEDKDEIFNNRKVKYLRNIQSSAADMVLMMDVIEHIADDVEFVKFYVDKVHEGSFFLVSVPAFNFMWSEHDIFLEHKRRYSSKTLRKTLEAAGLTILDINYFFGFVFPFAAATRFARKFTWRGRKPKSQLHVHSVVINCFLSKLCLLERRFLPKNKLGGLSVFCIAQKT